tara:strand:+ start:703 stop:1524 length:822 start_codon:yes stop_codon:yes gene_type:complete
MEDTATQPLEPDTPEYNESMIQAAEAEQNVSDNSDAEVTPPERPEHVPEKFFNAETGEINHEAWAKETQYWQKKAGGEPSKDATETNPDAQDTPSEETPPVEGELSFKEFTEEYQATGQLSNDSYQKLDKAGIPKDYVDAYIKGQEALSQAYQNQMYALAGGKEAYGEMIDWAKTNLPNDEITKFNSLVESGNSDVVESAIQNMHQRYVATNGQPPKVSIRGEASSAQTDVFRSEAEMRTAMSDPRYASDPAYRQDVEQKLLRSKDILPHRNM